MNKFILTKTPQACGVSICCELMLVSENSITRVKTTISAIIITKNKMKQMRSRTMATFIQSPSISASCSRDMALPCARDRISMTSGGSLHTGVDAAVESCVSSPSRIKALPPSLCLPSVGVVLLGSTLAWCMQTTLARR